MSMTNQTPDAGALAARYQLDPEVSASRGPY
jgi:hypothetical protein